MKLIADEVRSTFAACLADVAEGGSVKVVEGIMNKVAFATDKLEQYRVLIDDMLDELPSEFHQDTGGGYTFLNACDDRHGRQWTGMHATMDQLFTLGIGIGRVNYLLPRPYWDSLPGGMPYLTIRRREEAVVT